MKKQKKIEKSMEFKKYYLSEFQFHDGEVFITFDIVAIDTSKNEITVAISNRGRISVTTYDLLTDRGGMTPYAVSRCLKMSNHGIYNRVNRAREKYIKVFGDPYSQYSY